MYQPFLFVHSWMRWGVVLGAVYFLVVCLYSIFKNRKWAARESHFVWAYNQIFLYQALFGFALWVASSPIVHAAWKEPGLILSTPLFSFWVVRHPLTMIFAVAVFHAGRAYALRKPIQSRFKIFAVTFTFVLALITSAIPWPFLEHGRLLFRGF